MPKKWAIVAGRLLLRLCGMYVPVCQQSYPQERWMKSYGYEQARKNGCLSENGGQIKNLAICAVTSIVAQRKN
jgi:hypothetical protein